MIFEIMKHARQLLYSNSKSRRKAINVQDAIDELSSESIDIIEHIGKSKNRLKVTGASTTVNGLTFTVNEDKSITVNGTAVVDTYFEVTNGADNFLIKDTAHTLSGCPSGGSNTTYWLQTSYTEVLGVNQNAVNIAKDTGNGISYVSNYDKSVMNCGIWVKSGVTMQNVTFYPMIRLASVADDTYEPYRVDRIKALEDTLTKTNLTEISPIELTQIDGTANYTVMFAKYMVRSGVCYIYLGITVIEPFNDRYTTILDGLPPAAFDCEITIDERDDSSNKNGVTLYKRAYNDKLSIAFGTSGGNYTSMISYPIA